jgi:hypothetical protein
MSRTLLALLPLGLLLGCGGEPAEPVGEGDDRADEIVVPDGKLDDFFTSSGREYWVTGTATVTIEEALATATPERKRARALQLVALKNVAISWFLNGYLIDKEDEDTNKAYGGFAALTRFASEEGGELIAVNARSFHFTYSVQVAGSKTLLSRLPGTTSSAGKRFALQLGKVSNEDLARLDFNAEWYRDAPWSSFDPGKLPAEQVETMELVIKAQTVSKDAYLAYDRLFADGQLSIGVHFGWDYHSRQDISGSRALYTWLLGQGFASPVASYEALARTSGPLTKTIFSNGKPITVKLSLFHPGDAANGVPGPDPDTAAGGKQLEADMRKSFAEREVILFEGHSGPLYGFALANWKKTDEGDLDDSKIPGLELPSTYQIVFGDGCDTYALGQAFWKNPAKADHASLNVITSTSTTNGDTIASARRFLRALFNQTANKVVPIRLSTLTSGLDEDQGDGFDAMYGVHGVEANPRFDPMADVSKLGQACTRDAACGADGNRCTRVTSARRICTFACIDDSGCPGGSRCRAIASSTTRTVTSRQCVPNQ